MDEIKQIDDVLSYMAINRKAKTFDNLFKDVSNANLNKENYHAIIDKLVDDKYVFAEPSKGDLTKGVLFYRISFKGIIFEKNKGYGGELIRNDAENTRLVKIENLQIKHDFFLRLLTFLIAVGTLIAAAYYSIEIWKYYHGR